MYEDHGVDAVSLQQRHDVRRPERPGDRRIVGAQPRLRRVALIPEVDVAVDPHDDRRRLPVCSAAESGSLQAEPVGNPNRSNDASSISTPCPGAVGGFGKIMVAWLAGSRTSAFCGNDPTAVNIRLMIVNIVSHETAYSRG